MGSRGIVAAAACAAVIFSSASVEAAILISIDKSLQQMTVSVDGARRYTWPVSTGRGSYATPSGSFKPFRMEADHYSKEWDDAPMPHSIFFTAKGHAIHGSFETRRLGTAASHGCVRLSPANAKTLFALVKAEGMGNTKVVLTGQAPPMIARRPAAPQPGEPMQLRDPQAAQQPYGQPQYQQPYAPQPAFAQPYGQPRYGQPVYGQPLYGQRTYAEPQYREPVRRGPFPFFN
jgi:L,D-transpeptidase catalytic domain